MDAPFEMEINQFTDLTYEEFKNGYTGLIVPKRRSDAMKDFEFTEPVSDSHHPMVGSAPIPEYKNWYEDGFVSKPENQGGCGACWAFSSSSATESLALINGLEKELTEYSIQQLMDCDNKDNYGCIGGWMFEGLKYISNNGLMLKNDYTKYHPHVESCGVTNHQLKSTYRIKGIGYEEHDGKSNEELKQLLQKNPITVAIKIAPKLSGYRKGILTEDYLHCSSTNVEVDHGVVLVGYGKHDKEREYGHNQHCENYWIVRNSWGPNWGQDGFMKLCADGVGSKSTKLGTCLINKYTVWPTITENTHMNPNVVF